MNRHCDVYEGLSWYVTRRRAVGLIGSRKETRWVRKEEGEIKWRSQDEGNVVHALSKKRKRGSVVAPKDGVRRRRSNGMIFCGGRIIL